MNIRFDPCRITRLGAIYMIDLIINELHFNKYDNINELNFLKEDSFIDKMMNVINQFTIQILDLHQAYQEIDVNIFTHVQQDHRNLVENGYVRDNNLDFDFILTRNSLIITSDYINLLVHELNNIGLPHLPYGPFGYRMVSRFLMIQQYNSTTSNEPVVKYNKDSNTIEILDYKYNIIKNVMNINYTKDAGVDYYPDFANIKINCTF